jgi:UDP-3-O-[3-hydroxymyristoyl] glucosamine N-acyltransferase
MKTFSKLYIIGSGSHAINIQSLVKYFYPDVTAILKKVEDIEQIPLKESCHVAIGDNKFRRKVFDQLSSIGMLLPNLYFTTEKPMDNNNTNGCVFMPRTYLAPTVEFENNIIFNTASIVEHHSFIGANCHIGPGAVICGSVRIGNGSLIGANSTIIPKIILSKNSFIKAGQVVKLNVT